MDDAAKFPLVALMHESRRRATIALLLAAFAGLTAAAHASNDLPRAGNQFVEVPASVRNASYVGSQACAGCHAKDHAAWKASWHANMHREVRPGIVAADFNEREITYTSAAIGTSISRRASAIPTIPPRCAGSSRTASGPRGPSTTCGGLPTARRMVAHAGRKSWPGTGLEMPPATGATPRGSPQPRTRTVDAGLAGRSNWASPAKVAMDRGAHTPLRGEVRTSSIRFA